MTSFLTPKQQKLIEELKEHSHYDAITYCGDEVPQLLSIIEKQQKVIAKACEQRDEAINELQQAPNVNNVNWAKWCKNSCTEELRKIMEDQQ